ncbi:MAG: ribosomal RNA small subunit methyltransferase A [Candidatus Dormibacteraeota bacterium]|nr:ribosomal RNA small subunit methyltransferase A [Candidatus Dormibacteraeota bacterium]
MSGAASQERARPRRPIDLTNPATVRAVARRVGLHPSKRLGQHFLVEAGVLRTIVAALDAGPDDHVLEIGCGVGTLTAALAESGASVLAVDVDERCVTAARITQRHRGNVTVLHADALAIEPQSHGFGADWLAAGNLPYQLTGPLLSHVFELAQPPRRGVFLVQREVAARLSTVDDEWSLATVALRTIADVERIADVPPAAFEPRPAVHSSVIRVVPRAGMTAAERRAVIDLAKPVFQQRRKTLRHGLANALGGDTARAHEALVAAGVQPGRRPGTLGLDEWRRLARAVEQLRQGDS